MKPISAEQKRLHWQEKYPLSQTDLANRMIKFWTWWEVTAKKPAMCGTRWHKRVAVKDQIMVSKGFFGSLKLDAYIRQHVNKNIQSNAPKILPKFDASMILIIELYDFKACLSGKRSNTWTDGLIA